MKNLQLMKKLYSKYSNSELKELLEFHKARFYNLVGEDHKALYQVAKEVLKERQEQKQVA